MLDGTETAVTVEVTGAPEAPVLHRGAIKGIAILGSHPATVMNAPFHDESWAIYACSPHNVEMRTLPRVDQWCELHDPIEDPTRAFGYLKAVSEMPVVWMRDKRAMASGHFKGARPYPEEEMRAKFCPFMFTSSIAYMLAKAISDCEAQGIRQIGIWGVMQQSENEYTYQRPGIQYFIWEATRRGIKVVANRESCLFDPPKEKW
jgi:hypothetical protein